MSDFPLSVDELQARVCDARAAGTALRLVGGGVQQHIGYPVSRDSVDLSLTKLARVVEYAPDDMVVIAQAGMTLAALQALLAERGQWLPLEIAVPDQQTLGGMVATRALSSVRAGYGAVRDWLIGLAVVGGDGELIRGGGKVVKNVSGYDLPKLYCGSWGTLGAICEVAFKVAPKPEAHATLLAVLASNRNSEEALDALLTACDPVSTHLLNGAAAKALLGEQAEGAQYLVVTFDGRTEAVDAVASLAETVLAPFAISVLPLPPAIATPLRAAIRDFAVAESPLTVRYNVLSSQVGAFSRMVEWTANKSGFSAEVVSECRTGILHARVSPQSEASDWVKFYPDFRDKADRVGGSNIIERMPVAWTAMHAPVWSPVLPEIALMRGIKQKLDPANIMNPGRYIGGI